jgi:hypothetical protein
VIDFEEKKEVRLNKRRANTDRVKHTYNETVVAGVGLDLALHLHIDLRRRHRAAHTAERLRVVRGASNKQQ